MCAIARRFDSSYRRAHNLILSGSYGPPVMIHSQTADLGDGTRNLCRDATTSGGIFVDCFINDIDLILWLIGEHCKLKSIHAVQANALRPGFNAMHDRVDTVAILQFDSGAVATLSFSRTSAGGQESATKIICERASFKVHMGGWSDHLQIRDTYGRRCELPQQHYDCYREAFLTMALEFTACCLDELPVPVSLGSHPHAIEIAEALQRSLVSGEKIIVDHEEERQAVSSKL